jgi:hypothetical protein
MYGGSLIVTPEIPLTQSEYWNISNSLCRELLPRELRTHKQNPDIPIHLAVMFLGNQDIFAKNLSNSQLPNNRSMQSVEAQLSSKALDWLSRKNTPFNIVCANIMDYGGLQQLGIVANTNSNHSSSQLFNIAIQAALENNCRRTTTADSLVIVDYYECFMKLIPMMYES